MATNRNIGKVSLQVDQNVDSADVLLHFSSLLGEGVCPVAAAGGTAKAAPEIASVRFQDDCGSGSQSMKQAQLLKAVMEMQHSLTELRERSLRSSNADCTFQVLGPSALGHTLQAFRCWRLHTCSSFVIGTSAEGGPSQPVCAGASAARPTCQIGRAHV